MTEREQVLGGEGDGIRLGGCYVELNNFGGYWNFGVRDLGGNTFN